MKKTYIVRANSYKDALDKIRKLNKDDYYNEKDYIYLKNVFEHENAARICDKYELDYKPTGKTTGVITIDNSIPVNKWEIKKCLGEIKAVTRAVVDYSK